MNNNADKSSSSSSDSESSDNDAVDNIGETSSGRQKRSIAWCGVEDDQPPRTKITWPPPPSTATSNAWRHLRPVHFGNPNYGTKMQLYSRTRQHLALYPDGLVKGTPDENDLHTYLELINAGHTGHVKIKGLLTNQYVAMDHKGRLYATMNSMDDGAVFIEMFQGSYSSFLSQKYAHLGWYLGIKRSGRFKKGPKTKYGQKAVRFLPRRSKFT